VILLRDRAQLIAQCCHANVFSEIENEGIELPLAGESWEIEKGNANSYYK
jgi:hypothetical protein